MKQCLIMCSSLTCAQRGERLLKEEGISVYTVKAPQHLRAGGCGYALSLRGDFKRAAALLKREGLLRGKLYCRHEGGEYWEAEL